MSIFEGRLAAAARSLALLQLACGALCGTSACTHLFYQPTDILYVQNPEKLGKLREEVEFRSADGTKLAGWYLPARHGGHRGTVVQFHGNGQNMTAHFASLYWLTDEGYDLFAFDYRGYGISEGKPSQDGVNADALAAIHYVMQRQPASESIFLYGQSLGGAILLRALDDVPVPERGRVKGVVAEGTFYSYHAIARDVLARHWLTFLLQPLAYILVSDKYSPEESIARVAPIPLLVIHGDADPVVPFRFGEKVFELAKEPKRFLKIGGGGHIDSMFVGHGEYRPKLLEFLAAPGGPPTRPPSAERSRAGSGPRRT